ncbi:MAG: metallophosphoesterase [Candidatus Heimdallarchaeota archaeon]
MTNVVIMGDGHLGTEECLKGEFYKALESVAEEMDLIIFNGDFIDTYDEKGAKELEEFIQWMDKKGWKERMVFITGGMGHEGNILFDRPDIVVLPWAKIATEEGRIIVCHGHNIGLVKRKEETWREAAGRLKEKLVREGNKNLPKIERGDKIIISHTHAAFYDMENDVFATGGWKVREELKDEKDYIERNVGVFIIIDDEDRNDPIKMKRWMKERKEK